MFTAHKQSQATNCLSEVQQRQMANRSSHVQQRQMANRSSDVQEKKRSAKSFSRRIIKVWIFGIAVPLLIVEALILWQFYRINHNDVDEEIENSLSKV